MWDTYQQVMLELLDVDPVRPSIGQTCLDMYVNQMGTPQCNSVSATHCVGFRWGFLAWKAPAREYFPDQ